MGPDVHPGRVEPDEERLVVLHLLINELVGGGVNLLVDRRHPRHVERAGVLDRLTAFAVAVAVENTPGTVFLAEFGILGIVIGLGFFLGVEVIEVAEKFVEAVDRRQVRVAVAEVILAELAGGIALTFEQVGNRRGPGGDALRRTRHPDRQQAGPERVLAEDERRSTGGATLLTVKVGQERPFPGDPIDVRRLVTHHAVAISADVVDTDIVAPDHQDIRLLARLSRWSRSRCRSRRRQEFFLRRSRAASRRHLDHGSGLGDFGLQMRHEILLSDDQANHHAGPETGQPSHRRDLHRQETLWDSRRGEPRRGIEVRASRDRLQRRDSP